MIVYVETNFLLELAYLQQEHLQCETLLDLATQGHIALLTPAFCGIEARMSLVQRRRSRASFREGLAQHLRELGRSQPYATLETSTEALTRALLESGAHERQRLELALARLLTVGETIPTTATILISADVYEQTLGLSPQDALVYASVMHDLPTRLDDNKCFITRNRKDFNEPTIHAELAQHACRLSFTFGGGLGYIASNVPPTI